MKERSTRTTKVIALVLSIVLVLGMLPMDFVTAFAANDTMGTLSAITEGGDLSDENGENAMVVYGQDVTLSWSSKDATVGRTSDGWWIGIKMTAPSGMTKEEHFGNVVYQTGIGEGWSDNKVFWNAQDSDKNVEDTERFITLWGLVNEQMLNEARLAEKTVNYNWRFDWNHDGDFEQKAVLKIDPNKVKLAKAGDVVYPSTSTNGVVTSLSEGLAVQGENNANIVTVSYTEDKTLTWCEKDTAVGRFNDGWWSGIKITAPSGMTRIEHFTDVVYQTKNGETWSENKNFWNAQDSDKNNSDTARYLTMWGLINESLLDTFTQKNKDMTYSWRFDWNADGVFEQIVILEIAPEKITLNDVSGKQVYPELGIVTPITNGTVSGVTGNKVVTVDEVILEWSKANTEIGRNTDGWWAGIKVIAPEELAESTLENVKYNRLTYGQTEWKKNLSFWNNKDSKLGDATHYIELWLCMTPAMLREAISESKNITNQYEFDWNGDGVFEQSITFTVVPSDKIVLVKENQTAIAFDNLPDTFVYGETPDAIKVTGGNGEGTLYYEISVGSDVASVDSNGVLTLHKAGTFIVKVVKSGDDTYNDGIAITKAITVESAEQTGFKFEDKNPADITFNDNQNKYTNATTGGQSSKDVVYEITDGADVADINSSSGELTIKKAGSVTVKATRPADDKYKVTSAEYTLTISKDDQEITFENGTSVNVTYGTLTYSNLANEVGSLFGTKTITYEITSGNDIAKIDSTGLVTFFDKKVGSITIKATKAEDDCYNECSAEYTLKVAYLETPSTTHTLEGETKNNSGWYTSDVTIIAPDGYQISYSNAIAGNTWDSYVPYKTEGTNSPEVYLRDANGGITDIIVIKDLKIDKTAPTGLKIDYTQSTIKKIIEKLSFGIYTAPVEVTLSATDDISGIAGFKYTYKNAAKETSVQKAMLKLDGNSASYTFKIDPQFRDTIIFAVQDIAGNTTEKVDKTADDNENVIVIDTTNSKLDTVYTYATNDYKTDKDGIIYTQGDVDIQWTITESNFDLAEKPVVTVNDEVVNVEWSTAGVGVYKLSGNGDYKVKLTFTDVTQTNSITYEQEIRIDEIAPEISIEPAIEKTGDESKIYYNGSKTFKITINEHNFNIDNLTVNVISSNALAGVEVQDYAEKIKNGNWTHTEDEHTVLVDFEEDAQYQIILNYKDLSGRTDSYITREFVIDNKSPKLKVELSSEATVQNEKYYSEKRTATITINEHNFDAKDVVINVTPSRKLDNAAVIEDYQATLNNPASWTQSAENADVYTATIDFVVDANYIFTVDYADLSGRTSNQYTSEEFVIDNKNPELKVDLSSEATVQNEKYYSEKRTATITINEHNFDAKDVVINVTPSRKLDNAAVIEDYQATLNNPASWTQSAENADVYTATIDFKVDANYEFTVNYTDLSGRVAQQHTENEFVIDNKNPELKVDLSSEATVQNEKYYSEKRTATITINEHNFDAKDVVINVTPSRKLDNAAVIEDYQATLNNPASWTQSAENVDVYIATIDLEVDANYEFTVDYTDLSGRVAQQHTENEFVIDNKNPELKVDLSSVATIQNEKYYSEKRTATITINEHNFDAKDVVINVTPSRKLDEATEIEDYQATLNNPASWTQSAENTDIYTATIDFEVDANYIFTVDYTDLSGRASNKYASEEFVIDNKNPELKVDLSSEATVQNEKYYSEKRTATITINEHNFDAKDVVINVTPSRKLDEATEIEDYQATLNNPKNWSRAGDVYTTSIDFAVDANYAFTVDYTDLSGRVAAQHTENEFVIDNVDPKLVSVEYTNKDGIVKDADGREFVDIEDNETVSATIIIDEHNFDPKYVDVVVTAKDVTGKDVLLKDSAQTLQAYYNELFKKADSWSMVENEDDVYAATIVFVQDANYTFDINFVDLAGRSINSTVNYPTDLFTIDREAPTNLKAIYSDSVFGANVDGKDYEYYGDKMTVTISGEDATAGIRKFSYSYLNDIGVSAVNASGTGEIKVEDIQQVGYTFTATFTIPKEALSADKQFNGTIEFTAFDVIDNNTNQKEQKRIVVDNIVPTAQITYNDPVKKVNDISYYAGDITGRLVINEANFYSQDIQMVVTRDGNPVPVAITWVDNSVDVHTGTFTLHDDGDYIVTINYADRSENKILTYTSNELTVDTVQPSVSVSNIKMNSANKDETYGFTITANDINFDASTFKPILQAVVRGEDGSYSTKTISLGDVSGSQDGQTYSYTVQNLEEDGIYTLTCAVKDMSDNAYASIRLEDGREYETVQFSINRDGSTFGINEYTEEVINQYYIYSIDKDIVLVEINADPITNYSVIVNGKVLESDEYTTDMTGGNGEWYKRTYTIPKAMFEAEGEYNIVVRSTDKAETEAYSDVKNIKVAFVVDQTAPILTISGLDTEGRYQTNEQTVTVIPTDDGGRLYSFKAIVYDNDGNPLKDENGKDISVRFEMEGEELLKYLEEHDGKITFTVPEGYHNNVQIICTDCAKNSEGTTNTFDETFAKVTVSASQIVIFYANKPLFYGTVAGLAAIIGGIIFVVYKKRKREEK